MFASAREFSGHIRQRNHQHQGIERRSHEAVPPIEPLRIAGDGVDQDRPNAGNISRLESPQHGIAQKPLAKAAAMKFLIHREPADDHYWDGIGHVATDTARSAGMRDRANGQRIIGGYSQACAHYIGAGCAARLILQGTAAQPVIQCRLAALKQGKIVIVAQFFRGRKGLPAHCPHGAAVRIRRRNRGLAAGGRSSIDIKRLKSSAGNEK